MPFTGLPYEIRLLIWKEVLHQPRNIYLRMRYLEEQLCDCCPIDYNGPGLQCLCYTPVPVLLHVCSETRALALAHYELAFGCAKASILRPRRAPGFGQHDQIEHDMAIERSEAELANFAPKVYINFRYDTVIFGCLIKPCGPIKPSMWEPQSWAWDSQINFPYGNYFGKVMQRIENLALSIHAIREELSSLEHRLTLRRQFPGLKRLYLVLESVMVRPGREVELVDLAEKVEGKEEDHERIAQQFVDEWNWWQTVLIVRNIGGFGGGFIDDTGTQGVKRILDDGGGLDKTYTILKKNLLRNGAPPETVLNCVYLREYGSDTWLTDNNR